jgi:hypothetical protein
MMAACLLKMVSIFSLAFSGGAGDLPAEHAAANAAVAAHLIRPQGGSRLARPGIMGSKQLG